MCLSFAPAASVLQEELAKLNMEIEKRHCAELKTLEYAAPAEAPATENSPQEAERVPLNLTVLNLDFKVRS
jgi:hypothetical protein